MTGDAHSDLLERATVALEANQRAFERHAVEARNAESRAQERHRHLLEGHRQLLERSRRSEAHFIGAMSEISVDLRREGDRLDEMKHEIKANTAAVLSVLDRLPPQ